MILNTSEAARHLGYRTRTTLQRLLRDGHLDRYRVPGGGRQVLLETAPEGLPTLREQVQALTQIRHSSPLWRRGGGDQRRGAGCCAGAGMGCGGGATERLPG